MLILTRRFGETIIIGNDIKVTVLDIRNKQVRLGIEAPRDIAVHREEVYNKIHSDTEPQPANDAIDQEAQNE
jgi:carbon storage regulator